MAHQHKPRRQRESYVTRFEQRYGMTRGAWRLLKKESPREANELRVRLANTP